jgi:hypothetical protein
MRGPNICDGEISSLGGGYEELCTDQIIIEQYFYEGNDVECKYSNYAIDRIKKVIFLIDNIWFIEIIDNSMNIVFSLIKDKQDENTDRFIKERFGIEYIRFCAENCPFGGIPGE